VPAQLSLEPMIAEFMDIRILLANGVAGGHSLGDPLVVIIWFSFLFLWERGRSIW
jgi:hypothetical protein